MVTFTGVATRSTTGAEVEGDIWTFDVQSSEPTPAPEIGDVATVAILRSNEPSDSAACRLDRPELQVGATYKVTAGQLSGSPILRVSLFVGGYSQVAPPPTTTAAAATTAPTPTAAGLPDPANSRIPRFVWLLGAALAITAGGLGALTLRRRTNRAAQA